MTSSLDQLFNEAYLKASTTKQKLPPDVMLRIYAYYKQATFDATHYFEFQEIDLVRAFKFNAWKQVNHLTQDQAKQLYIDLINSLNL
ncbi:acyl-CoA-binding protein [Flavobacterium sp. xlx-214]|uniref:acyl-CoA-binding protein n=1 Tax=unclassified Flavobacterium TaxID=196869 RepID=UPI0013D43ABA|nr:MULTISPECIES: acyl-CoA-binding protein [unclassified Flavobacterium]MBA5793170.1 acyl-CoA-binding protein [Flavobacterium sp. xlx-221]QMI82546.1 acyl-CoA-binding protein [Flavobacterium sp. xlx-214]